MRLVASAFIKDLKHYKDTNDWASSDLSSELNNEIADCFREVSIRTERIDDDKLRDEISQFRIKMSQCLIAKSYESGKERMADLTKRFEEKMPELGTALRKNY